MSKISDAIRECVKGSKSTEKLEYNAWGILTPFQRGRIRELCDACDMFENSADNYCRSWHIYNYALDFALERIKYLENLVKENTKICVDTKTDKDWLIRNGAKIFKEKVYKRR